MLVRASARAPIVQSTARSAPYLICFFFFFPGTGKTQKSNNNSDISSSRTLSRTPTNPHAHTLCLPLSLSLPHPRKQPIRARARETKQKADDAEVSVSRTGASRVDTVEIGKLAVWSVTSAKPGNGVELLRDNNLDTYWQSDGAQPHLVNIQFQKKVKLRELAIYADYKLDESYTPSKISVRAGNSFHDLREIKVVNLEEPMGWVRFPLTHHTAAAAAAEGEENNSNNNNNEGGENNASDGGGGGGGGGGGEHLRAYFLQLAVLSNHQNGRDTHIRQVKIFGPRTSPTAMMTGTHAHGMGFQTPEFSQFTTVR